MKNSWAAGDTLGRSKLNQPFFVQSGYYNSGDDTLHVQVSAGRMRFPYEGRTLSYAGSRELVLTGPRVSSIYSLFITSDGALMASGHPTFVTMPDAPRVNSEYIGSVQTANPVATATLVGPWNMAATGHHETRGEMYASTAGRTRAMDTRQSVGPGGQSDTAILYTAAGIGGLTTRTSHGDTIGTSLLIDSVTVQEPRNGYSMINASVRYMPSGALSTAGGNYAPSGLLRLGMHFWIECEGTVNYEHIVTDSHTYLAPQNPDKYDQGMADSNIHHMAFACLVSGQPNGASTYNLRAHQNTLLSDVGAGARICGYSLIVQPGFSRRPT